MCMATYIPRGSEIPAKGLENGANTNNDGHGWALAAEPGMMLSGKSMDFDEALEGLYEARDAYPDAPALFHSRWATHGSKNVLNAHPFPVGQYSIMAHNGVMPSMFHPARGDDRTDSAVFADVLSAWSNELWSRRSRRTIGGIIGSHNKLVILSVNPRFTRPQGFIVNPNSGVWDKDLRCWFSNEDYLWTYNYRHWGLSDSYLGADTLKGSGAPAGGTSTKAVALPEDRWVKDPVTGKWSVIPPENGTIPDECVWCYSSNTVDEFTRVCSFCRTCNDCGDLFHDCLCYTGQSGDVFRTVEIGDGTTLEELRESKVAERMRGRAY